MEQIPPVHEAPSVTFAEVKAAIVKETYTVLPNGRTTVCQLTLDNGFTVEGQSACVSIENFDPVKGNKYAYDRAIDDVWKLLGFRLADKLHAETVREPTPMSTDAIEASTVGDVGIPIKPIEMGDQVHYFEMKDGKVFPPMLAIVAQVLDHDHVALTIHAPNGTTHARERVRFVYPGDSVPNADIAYWAKYKR